jgi:hypothetical protein
MNVSRLNTDLIPVAYPEWQISAFIKNGPLRPPLKNIRWLAVEVLLE